MEELKSDQHRPQQHMKSFKTAKDHHEKIDQSFQAIEQLYFYVCEFERALQNGVKENKVRSSKN